MFHRLLQISAATLLATTAQAQVLTQSPIVLGQPAFMQVDSAGPASLVYFVASFTGTGSGPCLTSSLNSCIGILDPIHIVLSMSADAAGQARFDFVVPAALATIPMYTQAAAFSFPGGQFTANTTNVISAAIEAPPSLSDDFAGMILDPTWQILHPEIATVEVSEGELHITPIVGGGSNFWYNDGEGVLVYREVTGDFTVTTIARAHQPLSTNPPATSFRLGGLLVRNPNATIGVHNWAHIATGAGIPGIPFAVEDKTTIHSVSTFQLSAVSAPHIELRLERQGNNIIESWRDLGSPTWTALATYAQPSFPATVQVGLMAYTNNAVPNMTVSFDEIVFTQ